MIDLQNEEIRVIEDKILQLYNRRDFDDYTKVDAFLDVLEERKKLINKKVLQNQADILPDIIAFNDALTNALRDLYNRALNVYNILKTNKSLGKLGITANCYLGDYPKNHPVQGNDREDFWFAIRARNWYPGNSIELQTCDLSYSFESNFGLDCQPYNWNEGLDPELTKDLHLTLPFHFLFTESYYAITDLIYVRQFHTEINVGLYKDIEND
ncbi:MAG: hypothetical protein J6U04_04575 [Salinivirgaceae bacterium]|nr:hypothetical protein [Salinivirgaceae bacterium]